MYAVVCKLLPPFMIPAQILPSVIIRWVWLILPSWQDSLFLVLTVIPVGLKTSLVMVSPLFTFLLSHLSPTVASGSSEVTEKRQYVPFTAIRVALPSVRRVPLKDTPPPALPHQKPCCWLNLLEFWHNLAGNNGMCGVVWPDKGKVTLRADSWRSFPWKHQTREGKRKFCGRKKKLFFLFSTFLSSSKSKSYQMNSTVVCTVNVFWIDGFV